MDMRVAVGGSGPGTGGCPRRLLKKRGAGAGELFWLSRQAGRAHGIFATLWRNGELMTGPSHRAPPAPHPQRRPPVPVSSTSIKQTTELEGPADSGCSDEGPHLQNTTRPAPTPFRDRETEDQRDLPKTPRQAEQGVQGLCATPLTQSHWKPPKCPWVRAGTRRYLTWTAVTHRKVRGRQRRGTHTL